MKYLLVFGFLMTQLVVQAQSKFIGVWKNVDDEDGKDKSHIQIYESNGKLRAKVIKLLPNAKLKVCDQCKGANKNKSIEGMEILWGMQKISETEYDDGEILNPKNGKIYDCSMVLEGADKIKVRGYLGVSLLGKTQYWYRVK